MMSFVSENFFFGQNKMYPFLKQGFISTLEILFYETRLK